MDDELEKEKTKNEEEKEVIKEENDDFKTLQEKLAEAELKNLQENQEDLIKTEEESNKKEKGKLLKTKKKKHKEKKHKEKNEKEKKHSIKMPQITFKKISKRNTIIAIASIILLILIIVASIVISYISNNQKVITVGDFSYTKADYMIYLKIAKDAYFGKEVEEIPEATLNTIVVQENNLTLEDYLKLKAEENLKIAGVIEKISAVNQITLSNEKLEEIEKEKQEQIDVQGGKREFLKWLKNNNTTEEAYDKMLRTEKLYNQIYENLYTEGKTYDLTDIEKEEVSKAYYNDYTKIRQIVLLKVNPITTEQILETEKQQKKLLADTIRTTLTAENFDEKIKQYSDNAVGEEPPYAIYFTKGKLLETIEVTAEKLKVGQISEVVESEYAYHIIIRDYLDEEYLNKLYEEERDQKLLDQITEEMKNTTIIIENALKEINIK